RHDLDLVDVRRVVGEDSLDADAVRDLADGERRPRALGDPADAHALEGLQASLLALADLRPDLDRVTRAKLGKGRLAALRLFDGLEDPMRAHGYDPGKGSWDAGFCQRPPPPVKPCDRSLTGRTGGRERSPLPSGPTGGSNRKFPRSVQARETLTESA